ncbi:MAG TPA: sigma-70 family RNA polymerase sigma factor [Gemmataceae bacterium]|nr:sigma-70 family RNA polymerase sigma factor [Gemmataceae bacterium]
MSDDDRRLIAECLGGRRDAFGELVSRYQARLYNAAVRLVDSPEDAADVVQDAFLNAYQSLHTFKGDAEFFTWLYRIAFNTAISLKRKRRVVISLDAHGSGEHALEPDDPSEYVRPGAALERTEEERQLHEALGRLSGEHRDVLVLKDIEGMKYEEIAEVLGVPIGTIRSRLHRARLELRDLLLADPNARTETEKARPSPEE